MISKKHDSISNISSHKEEIFDISSTIQHHALVNKEIPISPSLPEQVLQKSEKNNQEKRDEPLFSLSSLPIQKTSNNSQDNNHQKSTGEIKSPINNYHSTKRSHNREIINNLNDKNITFKFPKNNMQKNPDAYFKHFSTLPETKRIFLKSIKVIETSRGILFSLSQVYQGIRQYIIFCTDPSIKGTLNLFLYTANIHIGALTDALKGYETKDPNSEPSTIISTCSTTVTLSVLTLLENAITQNTITLSSKDYSPTTISSEIATKLKELTTMSIDTRDVAKRLKNQLKNIRENNSLNYKQKFWENTNAFVKSVIAIAALAKFVSTEFPFSKSILSGLSTVTRSTKELTILLSISSFRFIAESQTATVRLKSFSSKPQTTISSISTSSITSTKPKTSTKTEHSSPYLSSLTSTIDSNPKYVDKTNLSMTHTLKSV
ncbi:hypothetical protein PCK2_000014 [Pneumocystis canis]|nr:hypothetical protein PCK2_000014 [Pneumocystis canis]